MKFRTEIEPLEIPEKIEIKSKVIGIGSCFAHVLGAYLDNYKITNTCNPFGILFNPISIAKCLTIALNEEELPQNLLVKKDEQHVHFYYHSDIKGKSKKELISTILPKNKAIKEAIIQANFLVLTFGTAWVHEHIASSSIVANCHKQDPDLFQKRLVNQAEFEITYEELLQSLRKLNPHLQILISVSPVIHSREGLIGNNISKSSLVYFAYLLTQKHSNIHYFPSYEIIKEDLRDYRFYKDDLIHPNSQAEKYVLAFFLENLCNAQFKKHVIFYDKILSKINHRPFDPLSTTYLKHLISVKSDLDNYPFDIDLEKEKNLITKKIQELENVIN